MPALTGEERFFLDLVAELCTDQARAISVADISCAKRWPSLDMTSAQIRSKLRYFEKLGLITSSLDSQVSPNLLYQLTPLAARRWE